MGGLIMARRQKKDEIRAADERGFRYFRMVGPLLERLHGAVRDRAGNRRLVCDGYVSLQLLYYFTPILTSLRGLQPGVAARRGTACLRSSPAL